MTVGDLYARQGDMSHAIEYFERLAQVYLNDGFNSKAIAIYKKIAKLARMNWRRSNASPTSTFNREC